MSENLNVNIEATVDPELIPCVESLESSHSDKTDPDHVEHIIPDVCINNSMDIIVPIESCVKSNCLILTENNVKINEEVEVVNVENPTVDKLLDIVIENTLDQMGLDATGTMHSTSVMSVPDVQNEIMEIHPASDVIDHEVTNFITEEDNMTDLSSIDMLKSIENNDSNEFNNEEIPKNEIVINEDNNISENNSISKEHIENSNIELSSEIFQESNVSSDSSERPLKINTRPQRQAAKKAENQIREIAKEIIKPLDIIDEKVIDLVEELSSPLKKVCCQCNRFRLCKFIVKSQKSIYLCQEDCVENYRRQFNQCILEKKCQQCLLVISEIEDKSYSWQTKYFCSVDCLAHYQNTILNSHCVHCQKIIKSEIDFGKYSRFISGKILLFCGTACSENYENKLSLCQFCQKELLNSNFEEFCSSFCKTKDYESRKKHAEPDSSVVDYETNDVTQVIGKFFI
uniref:Zinc finger MYM-type protein 3 n=1 Tax=Sipha flava TaxID=143950 RepID=A0A2S2RAR3_9HEMI